MSTPSISREDVASTHSAGPDRSAAHPDRFVDRHLGPRARDVAAMLDALGLPSLEALIDQTVPPSIRLDRPLRLEPPHSEHEALQALAALAARNQVFRSYLGLGYHDTITPAVVRRCVLENPGWYTQYTPYQPEISQGRLEALLNFQTMVVDLTGLEIANASLLDEATAAAEAMAMSRGLVEDDASAYFVSSGCHPQVVAVVRTRAAALGIDVIVGDHDAFAFDRPVFGALVGYPATDGTVYDYAPFIERAHAAGALVTVAADLLSLTLLHSPGELGADIAVGNTQRFGVPLGYGGPHAGYFATRDRYRRQMPGRIVGVSRDARGKAALRLALQTREQHIRREKATSNICTAQVLLAILASMYAVYHGPDGLTAIARRVHDLALRLASGLRALGYTVGAGPFFDTIRVVAGGSDLGGVLDAARDRRINLRRHEGGDLGIALDETTGAADVGELLEIFAVGRGTPPDVGEMTTAGDEDLPDSLRRRTPFLTHPVFHRYRSETELLRYIHRLQSRDLSLTTSMIPLGSCTMKLNAAVEMLPVTWAEFARIHPFAPPEQALGYRELFAGLERWLAEITGFDAVSLQPNAGSQGELSGLLVIREYLEQTGQGHRDVCLIPQSAHGTNPASAVMAGLRVKVVACDARGNVDLADLEAKAASHAGELAALMVTYPSTHGVFEEAIKEICAIVHRHGGQVYMDGANLNAQVGLCRPGDIGADVCHLNLHKTFCIPHGGGGPGMGPIAVRAHLAPFLPGHPLVDLGRPRGIGAVSAAPWGSPSILPISWTYITLMGAEGLTRATQMAILNANYVARRLEPHYPVLYRGRLGWIAHECIVDLRPLKATSGIEVEDVAKRLMDYGFHAPTVSFPVAGTLMIEPTESESKAELDRFCDALIAIRGEIADVEAGRADRSDNPLKNAPHTAEALLDETWPHPYSREQAAYPAPWTREHKFWPTVGRIDSVYGDRNLVCACPPMESYGG